MRRAIGLCSWLLGCNALTGVHDYRFDGTEPGGTPAAGGGGAGGAIDCDGADGCGVAASCNGEPGPETGWTLEPECTCLAILPGCDAGVDCQTCFFHQGQHWFCRKIDGRWQWRTPFDPSDPGLCGGFDCTVACCESHDFWCNGGMVERGLPTTAECPGFERSHACR